MPIRRTLAHLPTDRPVAVMMRHAARFPITTAEEGWDARLTEAGHEAAVALGLEVGRLWDRLGVAAARLWSSPIPRCQETASRFSEGLADALVTVSDIGIIKSLAGPYLHDVNGVMDIALSIGDQAFVRAWFDGQLDEGLLLPAAVAARGQVDVMLRSLENAEEGVDVHVSHDWNILLVREHFVGLRHEDVGMPGFLDGLALWNEGGEVAVAYGSEVRRYTKQRRL
jgi:phosphohistidine phosphatase SixA